MPALQMRPLLPVLPQPVMLPMLQLPRVPVLMQLLQRPLLPARLLLFRPQMLHLTVRSQTPMTTEGIVRVGLSRNGAVNGPTKL